jgi:alpha-tubulin suppressor-like RCC1 family protein
MQSFVKVPTTGAVSAVLVVVLSFPSAAIAQSSPAGAPCLARATAVIANNGQVVLNSNTLVDSFQSSLGPYGGANVGNHGNVRAATSIVLNSGAVVRGTLTPNSPAGLQVIQPPGSATRLGNVVVNSGQTLTLQAGSYVASSLTLNGNSSLVVRGGAVLIWVTGFLNFNGAANANGVPANLQFLVTGSQDVNVNSGSNLHGILYAPGAHVNLNAQVFGSVVGDGVSLFNSGGQVHYDQNEACIVATPSNAPIAAGSFGSCAIRPGGAVECWGNDVDGELGAGTNGDIEDLPVGVSGLSGAVSITQGLDQTCAILSNGTLECWGDNVDGELGVGNTTGPQQCPQGVGQPSTACATTPVLVPGLSGVVGVSAGVNHTCAVLSTGSVECWGDNIFGELGDGTTTGRASPTVVTGVGGAVSVSAGAAHTCAVLATGGVECWGDNSFGELGDGTTTNRSSPVAVAGITNATAVSAGFNFTCAVLTTGAVDCWGSNAAGQLGIGSNTGPSTCPNVGPCATTPVAVRGLSASATAVGANGNSNAGHACALLTNATVACWGDNTVGELGDNTTTSRLTPVPVQGLATPTAIAVGGEHACALLSSGPVQCWGSTVVGAVGNGSTTGPDQCPNAANPCTTLPITVAF